MLIQSLKELKKSIKQTVSGCYCVFGEEEYLKDQAIAAIVQTAVGGVLEEFNLHHISGKNLDVDRLRTMVESVPVMAQKKCIIVDEFDMAAVSDQKDFLALVADLPEYTVLVLKPLEPNFNVKPKAANQKLLDLLKNLDAAVVTLNAPTPAAQLKLVKDRFAQANVSISDEMARYFLGRCSGSLLAIYTEADKLIAYGSTNEITKTAIDDLVIADVTVRIFDLAKIILKGSYSDALQNLNDLFYHRESPVVILSVLSTAFIDLYYACVIKKESIPLSQAVKELGYQRFAFRLQNALRDASRFSISFCSKAIALLSRADYQLKSSPTEEKTILEQTISLLFDLRYKEGNQ